ncbi:MAG: biopolymer transporter ExbD [Hoeflea sp.]|nr:biopolymer transporter ExbD [Alphaproteobacteria bacterium]MBU4546324.1 biopolymer transporter ExbD [Alphaproteobacteria bacterium]MBU4549453.1 biopolymer transporter ExbD [Alphaproteobacteria bacterium]MBV1722628.1 biopolymer transporter ExbD [Hoeflea sp.]MBV1782566.1 biopolymer transporter ExbD [Hoeflea sp.]
MLIFFLVAGTLAPAPDREVDFITLAATDPASPPDMLFVRADGTLTWRGEALPITDHVRRWQELQQEGAELRPLRIAADRSLPAIDLLETIDELRSAGVDLIVFIAERQPE